MGGGFCRNERTFSPAFIADADLFFWRVIGKRRIQSLRCFRQFAGYFKPLPTLAAGKPHADNLVRFVPPLDSVAEKGGGRSPSGTTTLTIRNQSDAGRKEALRRKRSLQLGARSACKSRQAALESVGRPENRARPAHGQLPQAVYKAADLGNGFAPT
jgi:hypothetical protein